MHNFIKSKLLFLSGISLVFILVLSFVVLYEIVEEKKNLQFTKHHILEADAISEVVHNMQIERGVTIGFIASNNLNGNGNELLSAKENLDKKIEKAKSVISVCTACGNGTDAIMLMKNIADRKKIDFLKMSAMSTRNYYTHHITNLLNFIKMIPLMMNDKENRNYIQSYVYLSLAKEALGRNRAILMEAFTKNRLTDEHFVSLVKGVETYRSNMEEFQTTAPKDVLAFYKNTFVGASVEETSRMIDVAIKNKDTQDFGINPSYWFKEATETINLLQESERNIFQNVSTLIDEKIDLNIYKIALVGFFLAFTIIATVILMIFIIRKILSSTDVLEKEYDNSLLLLEEYKSAVDRSFIVSKTDSRGVITYANDEFCKISGYAKEELLGKSHNIVRHPDMPKQAFEDMWHTIKELKRPWFGEIKNRKKDGSYYWVKVIVNPIFNRDKEIVEYIAVRSDITEIKDALTIDALTGYDNRFKLNSDMKQLQNLSVAIFNIDNFRQINDFYGHKFGDLILISVANKIYKLISESKNLNFYRLQGDEFAILGVDYSNDAFVEEMRKLLKIMKEKFSMKGEEILLSWSCGISFEYGENVLTTANMALKTAKKNNIDILLYDESISLNTHYENNMTMTKKIATALQEERIVVYYQAIVDNSTLAYEKFECLVRMIDEDKVLSPFFFLDIAKQTKQYFEITKAVILNAFKMFEHRDEELSINLSVKDMLEPEVRGYILMMLEKYNIGSRVVFEIVESEYIENLRGVLDFISEVKKYNCKISIDDFGTGYSNFEYLIKLKADCLKIDGSLIKNIDKDDNSYLVVSSIVDFAKKLGMKTVAEFVENEEIFKIVKELGIDYSQGYYFSTPKETI